MTFPNDSNIHDLNTGMQISRDLRRSSLGLEGQEIERHRTRRSLMSIYLIEKRLGEEGAEVTRWLFSRSQGSRLVMADIFDSVPIPSSSMADEYAIDYINEHILTFRWLYSYILYGDPEIERGYTIEEYDMSNRWWREYEDSILNGILNGSDKAVKRKGVITGS